MEKGTLAKTLEDVGCRLARAKDYSWKVKDMTPKIVISILSQNCHKSIFCLFLRYGLRTSLTIL